MNSNVQVRHDPKPSSYRIILIFVTYHAPQIDWNFISDLIRLILAKEVKVIYLNSGKFCVHYQIVPRWLTSWLAWINQRNDNL